jgi:hypothetical protein
MAARLWPKLMRGLSYTMPDVDRDHRPGPPPSGDNGGPPAPPDDGPLNDGAPPVMSVDDYLSGNIPF